MLSRKWPHAAGIKPLYRAQVNMELLLQPPSSENTLSLLNQSRVSTAARTSQHIQRMEEKGGGGAFKLSLVGLDERREGCEKTVCTGLGTPVALIMGLELSEMSDPCYCLFTLCTDGFLDNRALHQGLVFKIVPQTHGGLRAFKKKTWLTNYCCAAVFNMLKLTLLLHLV